MARWVAAAIVAAATTWAPQIAVANLPLGACCLESGVCEDLMSTQCESAGGEFIGEGTSCAAIDCTAPLAVPLLSIAGIVVAVGILGGLGLYHLIRRASRA